MSYSQAKKVVAARGIIRTLCAECLAEDPTADQTALRRYCRQRYPWEDKTGWKYRAWLIAMRERFGDRRIARHAVKGGQADFFNDEGKGK